MLTLLHPFVQNSYFFSDGDICFSNLSSSIMDLYIYLSVIISFSFIENLNAISHCAIYIAVMQLTLDHSLISYEYDFHCYAD